jgi:hypothetical protein
LAAANGGFARVSTNLHRETGAPKRAKKSI